MTHTGVKWDDDISCVDTVFAVAPMYVINPPYYNRTITSLEKANVMIEKSLECWRDYFSGCYMGDDFYNPVVKKLERQLENNRRKIENLRKNHF